MCETDQTIYMLMDEMTIWMNNNWNKGATNTSYLSGYLTPQQITIVCTKTK